MECVYVATFIGREITTVLKIAVENVILGLCDSCDTTLLALYSCKKIGTYKVRVGSAWITFLNGDQFYILLY